MIHTHLLRRNAAGVEISFLLKVNVSIYYLFTKSTLSKDRYRWWKYRRLISPTVCDDIFDAQCISPTWKLNTSNNIQGESKWPSGPTSRSLEITIDLKDAIIFILKMRTWIKEDMNPLQKLHLKSREWYIIFFIFSRTALIKECDSFETFDGKTIIKSL